MIKKHLLPIFFLFFTLFSIPNALSQNFEPVSFTQRSSGIATWNSEQVVVFGTGLAWIDINGKTLDQKRIIEGLPSSDFIDAVSDGEGGLWLMTKKTVSRLSQDKKGSVIIDDTGFPKLEFSELHRTKSGDVYCLGKDHVFKVNGDNTYKSIYESEKAMYFKNMTVRDDGTIFITSYKNVHVLKPNGDLNTSEFKSNYSFKGINYTADDRVIILEYRGLYEYKDGELMEFLKGHELSRGLKLYAGVFDTSNNYWLYANEGNAFHNNNGNWTNYIPPADLKTGNFGEHMHKSDNGDIWMTLKGQMILRFDGNKWTEINIDKSQTTIKIDNVKLLDNATLITAESKTKKPYTFVNGELVPFDGLPSRQLFRSQRVGEVTYYSDENGLYSFANNSEKKLIDGRNINFAVFNGVIYYQMNKRLWSYDNGVKKEFTDNVHYLGWADLNNLKFSVTHDNKLIILSNRSRILSIYDGVEWKKIIKTDQFDLGSLKDMVTTDTGTYLFNKQEDIYLYSEGELKRIYKSKNDVTYSSARMIPSCDNMVWLSRKKELIGLKNGKVFAEFELPTAQKMGHIKAVIPVSENVYHIYGANEVIQCTLP